MIALDSLNSGGGSGVNLAPIYQELNFLSEDLATVKNDLIGLNIDLGTIKNDISGLNGNISDLNIEINNIQTQLTNFADDVSGLNAHDVFLFGPNDNWTTIGTVSGFLPDIYNIITQNEPVELYTSLNYNFNANYNPRAFSEVVEAATINNNIYKNE